ncbi:MAG: alkaline phosphatase [Halioglobus sp.]
MPLKRRTVLGLLSGSTFLLNAGAIGAVAARPTSGLSKLSFPQGVASGDPRPNAVMLWTRAIPEETAAPNHPVSMVLQVSRVDDFSTLDIQATLTTDLASDYTVRTYIDGLQPDTHYYYRFIGNESESRLGRTLTAPEAGIKRDVNVAFASCQHYEQGHYGSWARMLEDDVAAARSEQIDFVLHLGDFIYERCWHTRSDGSAPVRKVPPFPDGVETEENRYAVSLADYRMLYKTYLTDPHLQAARARWPFICTWDDHEFANDNHQSYNTYGEERVLEAQRKVWANQAWFEFIPATLDELEEQPAHNFKSTELKGSDDAKNQAAVNSLCIYRQLRWGKHVDLLLTDSRSYRTPDCLPSGFAAQLGQPLTPVELVDIADAGAAYDNGKPPALLPFGEGTTANPAKDRPPGTILGKQQRSWFLSSLSGSDATWKVWGNALPMLPLRLDMSELPFTGYLDSVFNLDSWAGFPYEVDYVLSQIEKENITGLVSLSGDHHMHAAGTIVRSTTDASAKPVGADFSVAGISSAPLFEELVAITKNDSPEFEPLVLNRSDGGIEPLWNMTLLQGVLSSYTYYQTGVSTLANWLGPNAANPGLQYVDSMANGYGLARFSEKEVNVSLVTLDDCRPSFTTAPAIAHRAHFQLPMWLPGAQPELSPPTFEGGAPFPFEPPEV